MKHIITAALILCSWPAQADQWSFHLVSAHPGQSGMNNITPGVSYSRDDIRLGVVRNSYKRISLYTMKVYSITHKTKLGVGGITGYKNITGETVTPAIAIEYDLSDNVSLIWFGLAFNVEVRL